VAEDWSPKTESPATRTSTPNPVLISNLSSATGNEKWLFLGVAAMQVIEVTRLDFPKGV
jgi:hypothetical protein